jgi:hypothetical protein
VVLVRAYEEDEYVPEYGLLLVRDTGVEWDPAESPQVPHLRDRGDEPAGSFACAGAGWVACQAAGEAVHEVRLELHDAAPPADNDDFDAVVETPYRASSGGLTLTTVTGGTGLPVFHLGAAAWFRLRVARRRGTWDQGPLDTWVLRFWPEPAVQPPVWLARGAPPDRRGLADDLDLILRWTAAIPFEVTGAALAERLLIDEAGLREAVAVAETAGILRAEGDDPLRLHLLRLPSPPQRESPPPQRERPPPKSRREVPPGLEGEAFRLLEGLLTPARKKRKPAEPPIGAPPRSGVIDRNGTVIVWRGAERVELAHLGRAESQYALETAYGILVVASGRPAVLVSDGGAVSTLDEVQRPALAVLGDGRRVVLSESRHYRRRSWYSVRVIDLASGVAQTMPWPEQEQVALLGAYGNVVLFNHSAEPGSPSVTMRWVPGGEPEPFAHQVTQVDPITGATSARTADGYVVHRWDGPPVAVRNVPRELTAWLAPGAGCLWATRPFPPALALFPVEGEPWVWPMAGDGFSHADTLYGNPTWEDQEHVLMSYPPSRFPHRAGLGIRLSIKDGAVEQLPPTGTGTRTATLVRPLHTPQGFRPRA